MHSRAVQNSVLFGQFQEHGVRCKWTGLYKMAIRELVTVCTLNKDVDKFKEGFDLLFPDQIDSCENLAGYIVHYACPELCSNAVNNTKCQLLFELFKKHGLKMFTTLPSLTEIIHEILNMSEVNNSDVDEVAMDLLWRIVRTYRVYKANDEYHAVISYLTEYRGVDINDLTKFTFTILIEYLQNILLRLCSVFSTPITSIFLDSKLDAWKINLLWEGILEHLPVNTDSCPESVELIRCFINRGFDVKEAIFRVDFSKYSPIGSYTPEGFNYLLEILEVFMDHGARLNPLRPREEPFLAGVLKVYDRSFHGNETRPKLYGYIAKCIERGVDPKSCVRSNRHEGTHEDLFSAVCHYYDADDIDDLIEFLCDCGANESLYRNNGADLWSRLRCPSRSKFTSPLLSEVLLNLLRRGLRTDYIDPKGNNVLHLLVEMYLFNMCFGGCRDCCKYGWFRDMAKLKFWDVLDALLDAGVSVHQVNKEGVTVLRAFKNIMPTGFLSEGELETVCSKCCERYMDGNMALNPDAELATVSSYIERLSPCS